MRRAVAGIAFLLLALPLVAGAATPQVNGAKWIASQEASDGGFSNAQTTGEALAAMIAGRVTGTKIDNAVAYLKSHGKAGATEGAYTGRIIAGLVAAKQNPRSFGGVDYVAILHSQYDASTGDYDSKTFFSDLIAANGANAAKDPLPSKALDFIHSGQCTDGGFSSIGCSNGSDVDTTAWAINVLIASGHKSDAAIKTARSYLVSVERSDGGFPLSTDSSCNCNFTSSDSTGLALSAINALSEDETRAPWSQSGGNPRTAATHLQTSNGSFKANKSASNGNLMSTINVVPGLANQSYPVSAPASNPKPTPGQTDDTSATDAPSSGGTVGNHHPSTTRAAHGHVSGVATSHNATDTARIATSTAKQAAAGKASASPKAEKPHRPRPTSSLLGFGGVTTKRGGLSIATWAAIAVGAAGLGAGIWFLRARIFR